MAGFVRFRKPAWIGKRLMYRRSLVGLRTKGNPLGPARIALVLTFVDRSPSLTGGQQLVKCNSGVAPSSSSRPFPMARPVRDGGTSLPRCAQCQTKKRTKRSSLGLKSAHRISSWPATAVKKQPGALPTSSKRFAASSRRPCPTHGSKRDFRFEFLRHGMGTRSPPSSPSSLSTSAAFNRSGYSCPARRRTISLCARTFQGKHRTRIFTRNMRA